MDLPPSYYSQTRPELAEFLPNQYYKVLEIGCAEGNFHVNLNQHCEHWGIDLSKDSAEIASNKLHKVLIGTYEEVFNLLPDSYFDLVICNDVIEHMPDHDAFFRTIKQKMQKNSFIVGSIPNVRYLLNLVELLIKKDWKYKSWGILDRTHLRFFTEKSLKRTFTEHEFLIEEFRGTNKFPVTAFNLNYLLKILLVHIFGNDTQFLQFGFRIKYTTTS